LKQVDLRRVFAVAALASLVLVYSLLWLRMITTPVEYTGADFIAFYAAGRIAQAEWPAHVYDLVLQQHYEEEVVGFEVAPEHISPFLHPPFIVPLARTLALDDFILSFVLWDLVMLVFLVLGALPLFYLLREGLSRQQRLVLLAGILLFFPCYASLVIGQDSAIFYFSACIWMFGMLTKKDWLAGLGLAGMTVHPHLALPLALPFLFKRRGVWWWFLIGAASLALFSLAYVGVDGIEGFFRVLLVSGRGENYHTVEEHMFNAIGLLWRAIPDLSPLYVHGIGWGVYLAATTGMCILWAKTPLLDERHIGLAVILSLFSSPHSHIQDLVLLIIPIACLMLVLIRKKYLLSRDAVLLPLAASLVLLFSFFTEFLKYGVYYLVILFLLIALWFPERLFRKRLESPG
jgi:hypothetical protein